MKNSELLKRIREEYQIPLQSYAPPLTKRFAFQAALDAECNPSNGGTIGSSAPHELGDVKKSTSAVTMSSDGSPVSSQHDSSSSGQKRQREEWYESTTPRHHPRGGDGVLVGATPCYGPDASLSPREGRLRLCSRPVTIQVMRGDTGRTVRFRLQLCLHYQWGRRHEFYHSVVGEPSGLELTETLQATVEHGGTPLSGRREELLDEEAAGAPQSPPSAPDSNNNSNSSRPSYFFEETQTSRVASPPALPPHLGSDPLRWLGPQTPTLALFALLKCCAEEALVLDDSNKMFLYRGRNAQSAEGKHHLINDLFSLCFAEEEEQQQQQRRNEEPLTICIIKKWN